MPPCICLALLILPDELVDLRCDGCSCLRIFVFGYPIVVLFNFIRYGGCFWVGQTGERCIVDEDVVYVANIAANILIFPEIGVVVILVVGKA